MSEVMREAPARSGEPRGSSRSPCLNRGEAGATLDPVVMVRIHRGELDRRIPTGSHP